MRQSIPWFGTALCACISLNGCGDSTAFQTLAKPNPNIFDTSQINAAPEYIRSFTAGTVETKRLTIDSGFKLMKQDFSLLQAPKTEEVHRQIERPVLEDVFIQGNSGLTHSQEFAIAEAGIFDLLIVIDNSSSMSPYQTRLGKTLPNILKHISNTNWQIAVVTTSSSCLRKTSSGQKTLTRAEYEQDPSAGEQLFKSMIAVGENGDAVEKGILRATQAMIGQGCPSESNLWLRPESQRAVLLVSDENNCGSASNEGCLAEEYERADYFYNRVGTAVTVNGLLLLQDPPAANPQNPLDPNHDCQNSGGYLDAPNPKEYLNLIQTTGGIVSDICRSNYSNILEQISLNVQKKINIQFELDYPAVASSLQLTIDRKPIKKFAVAGKTLSILEPVAVDDKIIKVDFKHSPTPIKKMFSTQRPADGKTFQVFVNNELLASKDFQFNPTSGTLELGKIPDENAEIKLRYRQNNPLPDHFTYSKSMLIDSLEVYADGKAITDFRIDTQQQKVILKQSPRDGETVRFVYALPGDKTLDYSVDGPFLDTIESFDVRDAKTGELLAANLENGRLVLPPEVVSNGRKVRVSYNLVYPFQDKIFKLKLDQIPFPDSLRIEAGGDLKVCTQDLEILPTQLSFRCGDEDFEDIELSYQHAANYRNTFDLKLDYSGPRSIRVLVNNREIEDFHMIGDQVVILKKILPPGAEVKVLVSPK